MSAGSNMQYILLVSLWTIWCALHSGLNSLAVTEALHNRFPAGFRFYRISYNIFAVVSLLPVLFYSSSIRQTLIVTWEGPWRIVPILLAAAALSFFIAGARRYDFFLFIGLRQIKNENTCSVLTEDCTLDTGGVLALVRHPWYSGGMLIVWARPLDRAAVLTNVVICGYLVLGAMLEERKLRVLFDPQYSDYQRRVSMFFPFKWLKRKLGA